MNINDWFNDNGDKTHRLNYDLTENSTVFDVGGFRGDWAYDIYTKYNCNIHVFEPVKHFYDSIVERFKNYSKIKVYNFGISDITESVLIYHNSDASSVYEVTNSSETIQLRELNQFIIEHGVNHIDLMKINIEGGEYPLMKHIINHNTHLQITDIQVQFHMIGDSPVETRQLIRENLSNTHRITYDYEFVWENWKLKI